MKYCEDCKHYREYSTGVWLWKIKLQPKCACPELNDGVVRKITVDNMRWCSAARIHSCGPEAKMFEPKEAQ